MKKVSVIVPIYNAENYIKYAIESLINQTYKNLEFILINDGSTDNTEKIIKKYKDKRIKYISKENTGISDTRNIGLDLATGDYIMFLDSDDYLESDAVQLMVSKIVDDECDLVICDYFIETNTTKEMYIKNFDDCNLKDSPEILNNINMAPWNKIYKKDLFKNGKNRFPVGLKYEDAPVVVGTLIDAKRIGKVNKCLYHYVIKKSGETITRDERLFDIFEVCNLIRDILKKHKYIDETSFIVKILSYYLSTCKYIDNEELRNRFINYTFDYLYDLDKYFKKCEFINQMKFLKKIILFNKRLLLFYVKLYNLH